MHQSPDQSQVLVAFYLLLGSVGVATAVFLLSNLSRYRYMSERATRKAVLRLRLIVASRFEAIAIQVHCAQLGSVVGIVQQLVAVSSFHHTFRVRTISTSVVPTELLREACV